MVDLAIQRNGAQPIYEQTKNWLRQQIISGQMKPESPVPDEDVLATQFGISAMTVRRALIELTEEGLLKRIRGKGTFVRGSFSPQRKTRRVGVGIVARFLNNDPGGPFYYRMLQAIQFASEEGGIFLAFRQPTDPLESFVAALAEDPALKALIVLGVGDQRILKLLERIGKPLVLLDSLQPESGPQFDEVNYTAEAAVFEAVTSLLQLGHRQIGMIRGASENIFHTQRQTAYERALTTYGVPVRPELIHHVPVCAEGAYACATQIFENGPIPTAIVCGDDEMASAVMTSALEHGLKLPRDLSVIGIGGYQLFTSPRLSTVRLPIEQLGVTAVKVLKERLENPTAPIRQVFIPAEWRPWSSCAPALTAGQKD
jgi:DNA-binding LacI/PurR family transcriptional regulator